MKSAHFSRRPKGEEFQPQQPYIKKKRINWGIIIYSIVLIILLYFLGKFISARFFYVEAQGQVLYKKLNVQLPADAQLIELFKEEGDDIKAGDTLFRYTWTDAINPSSSGSGYNMLKTGNLSSDWLQKELLDVQKDIERKRVEVQSHRDLLSHYKERLKKVKEGVYLNVYTADKLDAMKDKVSELQSKIAGNLAEIRQLTAYKDQLDSKNKTNRDRLQKIANRGFRLNPDTLKKYSNYYVAPIEGNLTRVFKQEYEVALESEKIMSVHKKQKVIVRAFFEQEDLRYIEKGDKVTIRFPDGSKSQGKIQQLYFSTHVLPKAFQKQGAPLDRKIAADIQPLEDVDTKAWRSFYKMRVTITKQMFKMNFPW